MGRDQESGCLEGYNTVIYLESTVYPPTMTECTVLERTHSWCHFYHFSSLRLFSGSSVKSLIKDASAKTKRRIYIVDALKSWSFEYSDSLLRPHSSFLYFQHLSAYNSYSTGLFLHQIVQILFICVSGT